jgi:hypothetical protein
MKNIFKITIEKDFKENPRWTDKQKDWIYQGYNLKSLFSKNLKTIARIDDFRRKFLMRFWRQKMENPKCHLCGENWHSDHLFEKCKVVEKWENEVYEENIKKKITKNNKNQKIKKNKKTTKNLKRETRIESMMDDKSPDHTFSWIYNWCIWKNYWEIVFEDYDNCSIFENQTKNLTKLLKIFEKAHLLYATYSLTKNYTIDKVNLETQNFTFHSLQSVNYNNEIKENKKRKKESKKKKKKLKN